MSESYGKLEMEGFLFMLPSLCKENLLSDDSDMYVLNTLPRHVISPAIASLMEEIVHQNIQLNFKTIKRIEFFMEVFAVTLSLDYQYSHLMTTVNALYKKWIESENFFADNAALNKYCKLIIKQLSSPFDLREKLPGELCNKYVGLLSSIIDTYHDIYFMKGTSMDKDTWKTLLFTTFGIVDKVLFSESLDSDNKSVLALRQKTVDTTISIFLACGVYDKDVWDLFQRYARNWAKSIDFLNVWRYKVQTLFEILNNRILNFPEDERILFGGVFSAQNRIKTEDLFFIFDKILATADLSLIQNISACSEHFARTCTTVKDISISMAKKVTKSLCVIKYPLLPFIKFFGTLIVNPSYQDRKSVDATIENIISLLVNFDMGGITDEVEPLVNFLVEKFNRSPAFLKNAVYLFSAPTANTFKMGEITLAAIRQYAMTDSLGESSDEEGKSEERKRKKSEKRKKTEEFVNVDTYLAPLFTTASIMAGVFIDTLFKRVWYLSKDHYRAHLLASSSLFGVDMLKVIAEDLVNGRPTQEEYHNWIVVFLGTCVRENLFNARKTAISLLNAFAVIAVEHNIGERPVCLILQTWVEALEWGISSTKEMFELCDFVTKNFKDTTPTSKYILSLTNYLIYKSAIHSPSPDMFGTIYSVSQCNEKPSKDIKYVTIGDEIFLSFVAEEGKFTIFSRGPFGKEAFEVTEDPFGDMATPTFLPLKEETIPCYPPPQYGSFGDISNPNMPENETVVKPAKDYLKWMSAPAVKFNDKHTTTLTEYLAKSGLLTNNNAYDVKKQDENVAKQFIKDFDELEIPPVVFVPIIHVMFDDYSLEFTDDKYERTTEYLQDFLSSIAKAYEVNDAAADFLKIPHLRTRLPMAPCGRSLIAFISPEMAADVNGAREIAKMFDTANYKIIFNETNTDINIELSDTPLFIVNRVSDTKYYVKTGLENTCFNHDQLMCSGTFTRSLLLLIEFRLYDLDENVVTDVVEKRKALISAVANSKESSPVFYE